VKLSQLVRIGAAVGAVGAVAFALLAQSTTPRYRVVGWNDLGMHCVDGNDYSVFSILPPFNNLHAQVVGSDGKLKSAANGVALTYAAVADPTGSINRTSVGKTNFWTYVNALFGVTLKPDAGLAGNAMPGSANTAQPMKYDDTKKQWVADGIPITPYPDGGGAKNYYPMMRVTAKNSSGTTLATADVVLPVSDEMDCKLCHASGTAAGARPAGGWVFEANPDRDYKRNILRLHDEKRSPNRWPALLTAVGYNSAGLLATADGGKPVLCAKCHLSNALPGSGYGTIKPLTQALHGKHAMVLDPVANLPMDSIDNRSACYRCHPGSVTKCLRGAMGNATAPDGTALMQCQSCHGDMATVGSSTRKGWLEEPSCENCHTGTATANSGKIRFTDAFDGSGAFRVAANRTFAGTPGVLYRMSAGHGGLQCEACHGSTHAEYPSSHANDNLQIQRLQGHTGTLAECQTCHATTPTNYAGGPHGMHPIGAVWVDKHHDWAEHRGTGECRSCHGQDYRGTVLSAALAPRTFKTEHGTKTFAKGAIIGCYSCHNGPHPD
jgi:hypothetical protein